MHACMHFELLELEALAQVITLYCMCNLKETATLSARTGKLVPWREEYCVIF